MQSSLLRSKVFFKTLNKNSFTNLFFSFNKSNYIPFVHFSLSNSKSDLLKVEQINKVRIISINRPEKRNCINNETAEALFEAFKDFDADENSYAAVLHGAGGNFCSGYDLNELASNPDPTSLLHDHRAPMGPTHYETRKPVIAAIEGYAVAGGMELALWCDIRIMEETAIMGVFNRRFGVPLLDGGSYRLPAIVGLSRALDIMLTGRPVRAPEAHQIGLANHVCACGAAIGRAVFYAQGLEKYPQEALRADRNAAKASFGLHSTSMIGDVIDKEKQPNMKVLQEAQDGAKRFLGGLGKHGSFKGFEDAS